MATIIRPRIGDNWIMADTYETTAVFSDEKTLVLDERLPIAGGRVRITVEPLEQVEHSSDFLARLKTIHDELFASGFVPRTREQVDAELDQLRSEWNN